MIPILYAEDETEYSKNGIGRLSDATSCKVVENRLTGEYELTLTYRQDSELYKEIKYNTTIKAIPRDGETAQLFDVYDIIDNLNGTVNVYARHVYFRLYGKPIKPYTATDLTGALSGINTNTVPSGGTGFNFKTDKTSSADYSIVVPRDAGHLLRGMEGSILDVYGGEFEYNNFTVSLLDHRGSDNGVSIRYGKNIKDLQAETEGVAYTGAYPYWYKEEIGLVQGGSVVSANGTFPKPYIEVMDLSDEFETKPTAAQLLTKAGQLLGSGKPNVSYDIDYESLYRMQEFDALADLERASMGDTVTVIVPQMDVREKARVYKTEFDVLAEKMIRISVGVLRQDLAGTLAQISAQSEDDGRAFLKGIVSTKSMSIGTLSSLAAGADTDVSSSTNIDTIDGYYPVEIIRIRSASRALSFSNASLTRGSSSTTVNYSCRNNSGSALSNVAISAIILYVKSEYATTI